jgi:TPR repeat protein
MRTQTLCTIGLAAALLPAIAWTQGGYTPVAQQPQKGPPCGHYMTPPCPATPESVNIPPGATADQIFELGTQAYAKRQYAVAAAYMERAAAMGHTRAQASLGEDLARGTGVPRNPAKAIYWLTLAADKGHRVAQAELGDLYEEADGVPQDLTRAFHYHKLGADQRWWQAELRVGLEYELGYGTPRSRTEALKWLDLATQDGKDGCSQQLAVMLRRSDTPARFKDIDELTAHFSYLAGQAYRASLPKFPAGKNCHEHNVVSSQSTYWCD